MMRGRALLVSGALRDAFSVGAVRRFAGPFASFVSGARNALTVLAERLVFKPGLAINFITVWERRRRGRRDAEFVDADFFAEASAICKTLAKAIFSTRSGSRDIDGRVLTS